MLVVRGALSVCLVLSLFSSGCSSSGDYQIQLVHDPCEPLALVPDEGRPMCQLRRTYDGTPTHWPGARGITQRRSLLPGYGTTTMNATSHAGSQCGLGLGAKRSVRTPNRPAEQPAPLSG